MSSKDSLNQHEIPIMKIIPTLQELCSLVGQEISVSDWLLIEQERIDQFAQATGDHQWIHTDPVKAANGPFKTTIAHGFLTLSLLPWFFDSSIAVQDVKMGVNYGLNKVRFPAPVPVNSRIRGRIKLLSCEAIDNNGQQITWELVVEREGHEKPVCIAQSIALMYA